MQAARNRVIVEFVKPEQKKGSILLPDTAEPLPTAGTVVSIGECRTWGKNLAFDPGFGLGDIVFFPQRAVEFLDDKRVYGTLLVQDVLGKYEGEASA